MAATSSSAGKRRRGPGHARRGDAAPPDLAPDPPRFDLRFEAGRALLRLARPLAIPGGRIERLELGGGPIPFPFDVTGGAHRFRTRRTELRVVVARIDLAALEELCAAAGARVRVSASRPDGTIELVVSDAFGPIAVDVVAVVDGTDLLLLPRAARIAADGPGNPWARLVRVARSLGLELDEERGAFVFARPLRRLLAEALVARGWRVADDRRVALHAPRIDGDVIVVEAGPGAPAPWSAGIDDARVAAPVLAALATSDLPLAARALAAARRRRAARSRPNPGAAGLDRTLARLALAVAVEVGGSTEVLRDDVAGLDPRRDPVAASVALRLALRDCDARGAADAARAFSEVERADAVAAAGLAAAASLCESVPGEDAHRVGRELLAEAIARAPRRVDLAVRYLERLAGSPAGARAAAETAEGVARRARSVARTDAERLAVAVATARLADVAAEPDGALDAWTQALALAPNDPEILRARARAAERAGDRAEAVADLARAAETWDALGDGRRAAEALREEAAILEALGRSEDAEARLERAVEIDAEAVAAIRALAALRERLGDAEDAAAAYDRLLLVRRVDRELLDAAREAAAAFRSRGDAVGAAPFEVILARDAAAGRAEARDPEAGPGGDASPSDGDTGGDRDGDTGGDGDADRAAAADDGSGETAFAPTSLVDPAAVALAAGPIVRILERASAARASIAADRRPGGSAISGDSTASGSGAATGENATGTGGGAASRSGAEASARETTTALLERLESLDPAQPEAHDVLARVLRRAVREGDPEAPRRAALQVLRLGIVPDVGVLEKVLETIDEVDLRRDLLAGAAAALRRDGRDREASRFLARAGRETADAGALRAAIELAERAGAWDEAIEAIDLALEVAEESTARVRLAQRRDAIRARRGDGTG